MIIRKRLVTNLETIYGDKIAQDLVSKIEKKVISCDKESKSKAQRYTLTQNDVVLITYGDQFNQEGKKPLETLHNFCKKYLATTFNTLHILPFFPYSSDDGFSVMDYYKVDPALGDWDDIHVLSGDFRLMIDGVFNHVSCKSEWFQSLLKGKKPYTDYFIDVLPDTDLSKVVRPRALPLLTKFDTKRGEKFIWTTFSEDQVDLNFASPDLFLEIVDVMLFYVEQGAGIIRIDAVPFLWKEIGTDCIHRPQTHALVKAFRAILDMVAPEVVLITESNVPFEDNISYLGEPLEAGETDEAQLVYQFSLGPLVLHTFLESNATKISDWVNSLPTPFRYFNFIASHDGIGLNPAIGILDENEIDALIRNAQEHGGRLSYKEDTDGKEKVYELNITLYDFLNDPQHPDIKMDIDRFIASQAIMLAVAGVPGVYVHSLFGSRNCYACDQEGNHSRSINREKFSYHELLSRLSDPANRETIIFNRYLNLLSHRRKHSAFNPFSKQEVLHLDKRIFGLYRQDDSTGDGIICLTNVSAETLEIKMKNDTLHGCDHILDLLSEKVFPVQEGRLHLSLQPYQTIWLQVDRSGR